MRFYLNDIPTQVLQNKIPTSVCRNRIPLTTRRNYILSIILPPGGRFKFTGSAAKPEPEPAVQAMQYCVQWVVWVCIWKDRPLPLSFPKSKICVPNPLLVISNTSWNIVLPFRSNWSFQIYVRNAGRRNSLDLGFEAKRRNKIIKEW